MHESDKSRRVLVIDDDSLVRTGLRLMLRGNLTISVVGELSGHHGVMEAISQSQPDVILMDVRMPEESGLSVARRIRMAYPDLRIVLMSSVDNEALYTDARNVGVNAFIAKTASAPEFVAALVGQPSASDIDATVLSGRELQVVEMLATGLSNDEISAALHLSQNTVRTYVSRAMDKTETANRVQLANWFRQVSEERLVTDPHDAGSEMRRAHSA